MSEVTRWYSSRVDRWLAVIMVVESITAFVPLIVGVPFARAIVLPIVVFALYGLYLFPTRYAISEDVLLIRYGVLRKRIPLSRITRVTPKRSSWRVGPALSLNRLEIRHGEGLLGSTLISPAERRHFIVDLALAARLLRDGNGGLVR